MLMNAKIGFWGPFFGGAFSSAAVQKWGFLDPLPEKPKSPAQIQGCF